MPESIVDVAGEEARRIALMFMGQQSGELKQLDKYSVDGNASTRGFKLDAANILRGIPSTPGENRAPTSPPERVTVQPSTGNTAAASHIPPSPVHRQSPPNQLEFDFSYDVAKDIAEQLTAIRLTVDKIYAVLTTNAITNTQLTLERDSLGTITNVPITTESPLKKKLD